MTDRSGARNWLKVRFLAGIFVTLPVFVTAWVSREAPNGKGEMVTVFVPTNNLYLGDIVMVPRLDVIFTGLSVEEGLRVILSAGTATPDRLPKTWSQRW